MLQMTSALLEKQQKEIVVGECQVGGSQDLHGNYNYKQTAGMIR